MLCPDGVQLCPELSDEHTCHDRHAQHARKNKLILLGLHNTLVENCERLGLPIEALFLPCSILLFELIIGEMCDIQPTYSV